MDIKSKTMPNIQFVKRRRIWYTISSTAVVLCITAIILFNLKYGLDFTGGSLLELSYSGAHPDLATVNTILSEQGLPESRVQLSGEHDVIIRSSELSESQHQTLLAAFEAHAQAADANNHVTEQRFESFGSSLGSELKRDSLIAIVIVLAAIIAYIAYAFRKVSRPDASWKFGGVAIIALAHDLIILIGIFAILGHYAGIEVDSYFITALLTLLGFSVHDTIVTLDRVRENLFKNRTNESFGELVNQSINQTIIRSVNTSTALLSLIAIYFFGGETLRDFSLALILGMLIGTYSSIFLAAPLLVTWHKVRS